MKSTFIPHTRVEETSASVTGGTIMPRGMGHMCHTFVLARSCHMAQGHHANFLLELPSLVYRGTTIAVVSHSLPVELQNRVDLVPIWALLHLY